MSVAAYDSYADWYEDYVTAGTGGDYHRRLGHLLAELLGTGTGTCLEVCCGTGIHTAALRDLGWTPVGVRARVGATHLPLAALLTAVLDAGLTLTAARETGPDGAYPDLLALTAHKPT
jgi:hypothetical protein